MDPTEPSPDSTDVERMAADLAAARTKIAQLEAAVQAHQTVGRACGILMALHRMDGDRAFAALKRMSMTHNTRLRQVAEALIALTTTDQAPVASPAAEAAASLLRRPERSPPQ